MSWSMVARSAGMAVLLIISGNSASAANVANVQGQVQISRAGGPFKDIAGPTVCNAGDVLRAVSNGSAQVINPDGVIQTATLGAPVKCLAGAGSSTASMVGAPGTAGDAALPAAGGAASDGAAAAATGGVASNSTAILVGAGIVAATGAVGVAALTRKASASP